MEGVFISVVFLTLSAKDDPSLLLGPAGERQVKGEPGGKSCLFSL